MVFKSQFRDVVPEEKYKKLVSSLFWHQLDVFSERVLFVDNSTGEEFTGAQIKKLSTKIAQYLLSSEIKLKPGEVCVSLYKNSAIDHICASAVFFAGGSFCAGALSDPENEHYYIIKELEPALIFCDSSLQEELLRLKGEHKYKICVINDPWQSGQDSNSTCGLSTIASPEIIGLNKDILYGVNSSRDVGQHLPVDVDCESPAFIIFTSGSTGHPKPVNRNHRSTFYVSLAFDSPEMQELWQLDETSIMAAHLPLDHGTGTFNLCLSMSKGLKLIIMESYNPSVFLKAIDEHRITDAMLGSAHVHNLISMPHSTFSTYNTTSLRNLLAVGSPITNHTKCNEFMDRFRQLSIRQGYGLTECGLVSIVRREFSYDGENEGVGELLPNVQVKLNMGEKEVTDFETTGELSIKAETVAAGYLGSRFIEQSKACFNVEDGYYRTTDICMMCRTGTGGRVREVLKVYGRRSDVMCLDDGWKVLPAEIEAVVSEHPEVLEVAIVGIPHPELPGCHAPRAYIVPRSVDKQPKEEEIFEFVKARVSSAKNLVGGIKFMPEFPRIAVGKVDKKALLKMDGFGS